jgi:hypothetical protein
MQPWSMNWVGGSGKEKKLRGSAGDVPGPTRPHGGRGWLSIPALDRGSGRTKRKSMAIRSGQDGDIGRPDEGRAGIGVEAIAMGHDERRAVVG